MGDWIAFWDSEHSIYVNARHRDVHYRAIADDIAHYVPGSTATVVDYGCGEALHADRIAAVCGRLLLVEAAPHVRESLRGRFTGRPNIEVRSPEELWELAAGSVDLLVMNSVAQYLTPAELDAMLTKFRRLLAPGGLLVLGDIVPPQVSPITDALALLRFAAAHRFLWAAIGGLFRTALSDYRRLRSEIGLTLYDQKELEDRLTAAGFVPSRAQKNIGHNQARMTFLARPFLRGDSGLESPAAAGPRA